VRPSFPPRRSSFGEKAREVKDTSLRMPHGEWGKVINVKVFSTTNGDDLPAGVNEWVQVWVAQKRKVSVGDKLAGRHGNKGVVSIIAPAEDMPFLPDGTPVDVVINPIDVPSRMNLGQILETHLGLAAQTLGMKVMTPVFDGADDSDIEDALARAWLAQKAGAVSLDPNNGETSQVQIEAAKAWVTKAGYDGEQVFGDSHPGVARDVSLRIWLEDLGIPSRELSRDEIEETITRLSNEKNLPPPILGKTILRDGRTGTPFDHPITVGCVYMMKLNHMVEDKVHARSTGPYSLISQQPLGGKAQFGGQRFGEMEVWALEAYGAAHNLQEMLTIKSDDVTGRAKTYEAIVKNENILQSGVPESFKVLIMELRSLGLAVEVLSEEEKLALPEKSPEPAPAAPEMRLEASDESTQSEVIEENA
jgi:DNA-directed RNA polymerase subunit beta